MREVVYAIRGKTGDSVSLSILRGDKVISKNITREKVAWSPVKDQILSHDVGVIEIGYFSNGTARPLQKTHSEKWPPTT